MAELTEGGVYIPKDVIVIASSFEGVINDGARECGLTSFNAYQQMEEGKGKFFGRVVQPEDFEGIAASREIQAFLKLRPPVEVAEDYLTVIEVIENYPTLIDAMLNDPTNPSVYDPLIENFNLRREESEELRVRFNKAFYAERKRMQNRGWNAWANTQSPFPESIEELRKLQETQKYEDDEMRITLLSGFVPRFATSKDEESTYHLCKIYSQFGKLKSSDVGEADKCLIPRHGIIGKERTRDKVKQLKAFAEEFGVPHSQVWRLNDRYDIDQQQELWDTGFHYQFLIKGGYAFPHDYVKAEQDKIVVVLDRKGMAKELGRYAEQWGF
ncbi:MAG: hypothetical protein GTN76_06810 [Candidatus Aenigmarchaeota archaeon]|nr:hypothetical protein [Candidatus Aenigmarchaeota archaeon]